MTRTIPTFPAPAKVVPNWRDLTPLKAAWTWRNNATALLWDGSRVRPGVATIKAVRAAFETGFDAFLSLDIVVSDHVVVRGPNPFLAQ